MNTNMIYNMDCITGMKLIPDKSIDMILCDLPYGITRCSWDIPIPFPALWQEYGRIIKDNGAIILTACQPFTTDLIQSNRKLFRYCWYWKKNAATNFANSHKQPMRRIEDAAVFYKRQPVYNPQGLIKLDAPLIKQNSRKAGAAYGPGLEKKHAQIYARYPSHLLEIPCERGPHPTQKPVALFEYFIRTYTNEGALVLDNCMGSGTTAAACIRSGRRYIGFETNEAYCAIAQERTKKEDGAKELS